MGPEVVFRRFRVPLVNPEPQNSRCELVLRLPFIVMTIIVVTIVI